MYSRTAIVVLINLIYFKIGLMVSVVGALIPDIIRTFDLSFSAAAVLPLAYYIAFGVLAIPLGIINEKYNSKRVLLSAYAAGIIGVIMFAYFRNYYSSVLSLFIIGCSLTAAQVIALPLLRQAVGAAGLAFHSTLNTGLYAIGAIGSPFLYTLVIKGVANPSSDFPYNILHYLHDGSYAWAVLYWIFLLFFAVAVIMILLVKFPQVQLDPAERMGDLASFRELLSQKYIYLYFFALFFYAACEQGNANWISQFLNTYHGVDPQSTGAMVLSWHWFLFAVGCMVGMVLLKYFPSRKILFWFTIAAMISLSVAIFGDRAMAIAGFALIGFFHSVMWPIILALGMNSVRRHHGSLAGLLFAASTGGAFGVMMIGRLGDLVNLRWGFLFLLICYVMVLSVYFWSNPFTHVDTERLDQPI